MAKYKRKPTITEAIQYTGEIEQTIKFLEENKCEYIYDEISLAIKTPEGQRIAHKGDYIVKGIYGGLHLYKPDVFEQFYEFIQE